MNEIIIAATHNTPLVMFEPTGSLYLKGRSLGSKSASFYEPLIEWAEYLNAEDVTFTVELDYMNTTSVKCLFTLFKALENNLLVKNFEIIWQYEEDDEDMFEKGTIYSEKLKNTRFIFNELIEA